MIEIKVGDYVETIDGYVGKIAYISNTYPSYIYIKMVNCYQTEWRFTTDELEEDIIENKFKCIGEHDFTIKVNKIEPLNDMEFIYGNNGLLDCNMNKQNISDMWNKINEIIDYINKEE